MNQHGISENWKSQPPMPVMNKMNGAGQQIMNMNTQYEWRNLGGSINHRHTSIPINWNFLLTETPDLEVLTERERDRDCGAGKGGF